MSEQLWYTWSASGFGMTTAGFRVRAASQDFTSARGFVDMQDERILTLMKYLNYNLPHDTPDPYKVTPQQAPRSLVFIQAGNEHILVNKAYTGLDGVGRAGAFFSHLLTDLPPEGPLSFSAREAIELWGSGFWKDSEGGFDPKQLKLPLVSREELTVGPLSNRDMTQVRELLLYVIQAFLTLPTLGEQKRLYIAGSPETVATLIWGLTHALPRTLEVMCTLTFSTYERDLEEKMLSMNGQQVAEKTLPVIVGTSWLSPSTQDLPSIYYREQNPHGLALNCYLPDRKTPLTPDPLVSKFAQFVIQCFISGKMKNLKALLNQAETQHITDIPSFLALYTSFQDIIPTDDVTRLLKNFCTKMNMQLEQAMSALKEGIFPPEDKFRQWKSIQSEIDILKRENVRNSIVHLLTHEPRWWQEQGQSLLLQLRNLAIPYSDSELTMLRATFIRTSSSIQRPKGQVVEVLKKKASSLFNSSSGNEPSAQPATFAEQITDTICTAQDELAIALQSLVTDFAEQIIQAIWADNDSLTKFWHNILDISIFARIKVNIWVYLLQRLSTVHYTPAYKRWWTGHGGATIQEMSTRVDRDSGGQLDQACSSFIKKATQELLEAIKNNQTEVLSFWQDVLYTIAPYTNSSKEDVWLDLLLDLCQVMHVPVYQQWWQGQGKAAVRSLRSLADKAPESKAAVRLSNCARNIAGTLFSAIADKEYKPKSITHVQLLLEILIAVTSTSNTDIWPNLLQKLSSIIHGRIDETYSWELRCLLLETWGNIAVLKENQLILRDWLTVRWDELDKLLSLTLPEQWHKKGVSNVLFATPSDSARADILGIVDYHSRLFEEVLEQFMKDPATQQTTMYFFALLAERHYARIFPLLDRLLAACQYHKEVTEKLLASLDLQSSQEIANLLENNCKVLLSEHELTATLFDFINRYLNDFDPEYLDSHPTRELLLRFLKRSEIPALGLPSHLHKVVEGWYRIAEFIQDPDVGRNRLRDLSSGTRSMTQLTSDARYKLAAKLVPRLVDSICTEIDLGRVIDNLGKVLVERGQGGIDEDLLLLELMAKLAGEKYGQEPLPVRIAPYIKVVLGESYFLPPAKKETFVDSCLSVLLKQIDTETRNNFTINLMLWPDHIVTEWKAYLSRSSLAAITEELNRFRSAIQGRVMSVIVQAYNPSLEKYLQLQEHQLLELARKFVAAINADDDATLVEVNDMINKSPYRKQLGCTRAQAERIKLAQSHMLALSQPSAPKGHTQTSNMQLTQSPLHSQQTVPASIAVVKGQIITPERFKQVLQLKEPYTKYKISHLQLEIQELEETNPDRANRRIKKGKKIELKELEKLSGHPERLRESALDNLVNDVLIREEIDKLTSQDPANRNRLDVETDLSEILNHLRVEQGYHNYPFLLSEDSKKILEILRIFRRHELLATYLYWNHEDLLQDWLKEQRNHEEANITINYALAGVKAPGTWKQIAKLKDSKKR